MPQARRWLQDSQAGGRDISRAPFAPSLWGCVRRFACFGAQHLSLSEQIVRMSQARRWFQHSQRGGGRGVSHGLPVRWPNIFCFWSRLRGCLRRGAGFSTPKRGRQGWGHSKIRAQIGRESQAVCLLACSTSSAFGAVPEDVSVEALVSALQRGSARRYITGPFAPRLRGCLGRFACFGP